MDRGIQGRARRQLLRGLINGQQRREREPGYGVAAGRDGRRRWPTSRRRGRRAGDRRPRASELALLAPNLDQVSGPLRRAAIRLRRAAVPAARARDGLRLVLVLVDHVLERDIGRCGLDGWATVHARTPWAMADRLRRDRGPPVWPISPIPAERVPSAAAGGPQRPGLHARPAWPVPAASAGARRVGRCPPRRLVPAVSAGAGRVARCPPRRPVPTASTRAHRLGRCRPRRPAASTDRLVPAASAGDLDRTLARPYSGPRW